MHVIFVEPAFPRNQREFVRGLAATGARVTGIGEASAGGAGLPNSRATCTTTSRCARWFTKNHCFEAVRRCQKMGWVDRLEATIEAHILPTANVREKCGIPGTQRAAAPSFAATNRQ